MSSQQLLTYIIFIYQASIYNFIIASFTYNYNIFIIYYKNYYNNKSKSFSLFLSVFFHDFHIASYWVSISVSRRYFGILSLSFIKAYTSSIQYTVTTILTNTAVSTTYLPKEVPRRTQAILCRKAWLVQ